MVFHRARRKINHEDIILNNNILQQVHCTPFLGIIIDDKLKWVNLISYIKNKIAKSMGIVLNILLVVSLHQSDRLSDTFFCDIVVNHEIIKSACMSQQRALEEMLHRLISFFTITRGVILIGIFPLS